MIALPHPAPDGFLFLVTRQGIVKRIALSDVTQAAMAAPDVMRVTAKDRLNCAFVTPGDGEVVLITRQGRSIRFPEEMVRVMGPAARGVAGINLKRGDGVIAALPVASEGELLTVTDAGFVKRTRMSEFSLQGRGGGGVIAHKISGRSGDLVGAAMLTPAHALAAFVTQRGVAKPVGLDEIPSSGRNTQGAQAVDLARSDAVASVQAVSPVVLAMDSPPPQPAPQANGRVDGARAQRASTSGASTRRAAADSAGAGARATGNGQKSAQAAPEGRKRTARAAATAAGKKPAPTQEKERSLASETARRSRPDRGGGTAKEKPAAKRATAKAGASGGVKRTSGTANRSRQGRLIEDPPAEPKPAAGKSAAGAAARGEGKLERVSSVRRGRKKR